MKLIDGLLLLCLTVVKSRGTSSLCQEYICRPEVQRLRDYVAIKTTQFDDLSPAVDFFRQLAAKQNVEVSVYEGKPKYPVVVLKWPGLDQQLRSIALVTPMDVSPACYQDGWTYPPFTGEINDDCEIVGRGTQVSKTVAIQHYEALSRLRENNETLLRDVYMILTPDQGTGSMNGIARFLKTDTFRKMNVGFALGVGTVNTNSEIQVLNNAKAKYILRIDCYGQSTHSALYPKDNTTALDTCQQIYASLDRYKQEQYIRSLNSTDFGDYTTVNYIGGTSLVAYDVIPAHLAGYFIINLALNTSVSEFNEMVRGWVLKTGGKVTVGSIYTKEQNLSTIADYSNPYWAAIEDAFDDLDITIEATTSTTTWDITFFITAGIPAFGITPYRNTPLLFNSIDERLPLSKFLDGICNIKAVIQRIANLSDEEVADDPRTYLE